MTLLPNETLLSTFGEVRLADILTFLDVCKRIDTTGAAERQTLETLFNSEHHTTTVDQLKRLAEFVERLSASQDAPQARRRERDSSAGNRQRKKPSASNLHLLFEKTEDPKEKKGPPVKGYRLTEIAKTLKNEFTLLKDHYCMIQSRIGEQIREKISREEVRIGATLQFGLYLMPHILSNWDAVFGKSIRLQMEINNTKKLLPQVDHGMIAAMIGYGSKKGFGVKQPVYSAVAFSSFEYPSRMVLICHPHAKLWLKNGEDANEGYWDQVFQKINPDENSDQKSQATSGRPCTARGSKRSKTRSPSEPDGESFPRYESDLRELHPENLDEDNNDLVVVHSWDQPQGLQDLVRRFAATQRIRYVESSDEAIAIVRTGLGTAVVPESYCKRKLITAFKLTPPAAFTRHIGVYYSTRHSLSEAAVYLLEFIRAYIDEFHLSMRNGRPQGVQNEKFVEWCNIYPKTLGYWERVVREKYPLA